jgi:hypothetical protein
MPTGSPDGPERTGGGAAFFPPGRVTEKRLHRSGSDSPPRKSLLYDKEGEEHYNLISALHKSLRDSDPDASLYWLAGCWRPGGPSLRGHGE